MKKNIKYIICGALSGIPNGFLGAGGGMIIVPLFCRWVKLPERVSFATSVAVILPMSAASAIIYFLKHGLSFGDALPFLLGVLFGGIIRGIVFKKVPTELLHKILGIFIIYGGVRCFF